MLVKLDINIKGNCTQVAKGVSRVSRMDKLVFDGRTEVFVELVMKVPKRVFGMFYQLFELSSILWNYRSVLP